MAGMIDADEIIDSGRSPRSRRGDIGSSNGFNCPCLEARRRKMI
jgi:hypothetical protein